MKLNFSSIALRASLLLSMVFMGYTSAFAKDSCKVIVGDSKWVQKVLEPALTSKGFKPIRVKNESLAKAVHPDQLVLQTEFNHDQQYWSTGESFNNCTLSITLYRTINTLDRKSVWFQPVITLLRDNQPTMDVATQDIACNEAAQRVVAELESCESYQKATNKNKRFSDLPVQFLENNNLLHSDQWGY